MRGNWIPGRQATSDSIALSLSPGGSDGQCSGKRLVADNARGFYQAHPIVDDSSCLDHSCQSLSDTPKWGAQISGQGFRLSGGLHHQLECLKGMTYPSGE